MKPKIKAVFDTNIYLSGIIFGGNPRRCLELARSGEIELFISRAIILELIKNLQNKFGRNEHELKISVEWINNFAETMIPQNKLKTLRHDPDNRILECALEAKVDYIVSGDKRHLLSLKKFKNIPIISSKEFLDIFFRRN